MNRKSAFILGALLSVALGAIAATGGGFPSRPRFQSVGVGTAAPSAGRLSVSDRATVGSLYVTPAATNWGMWTAPWPSDAFVAFGNPATRGYIGTDGGGIVGGGTGSGFGMRSLGPLLLSSDTGEVRVTGAVTVNGVALPRFSYVAFTVGNCSVPNSNYDVRGYSSCSRVGVGDYNVSLTAGYSKFPVCTANADTVPYSVRVYSSSGTLIRVNVYDAAGTAQDSGFALSCVGT